VSPSPSEIERLFKMALDLEPEARRRFLDQVAPPGSPVRSGVESLLGHLALAGEGYLDGLVPGVPGNSVPDERVPGDRVPDERVPDERVPGDRVPGDRVPGDRLSGAAEGLDTTAGPGTGTPADPPDQIGDYPILGELGRGGMGVVLLALDPRLHRRVAIKVLPEAMARDAAWLERFRREARLLASLDHPGIAVVHSLEEANGQHFLTMELVEGRLLSEVLGEGPLEPSRALAVGLEIAAALEAAHDRGIVHRDLKPANVILRERGVTKVLDFGLATRVEGSRSLAPEIAGTPGYMSPEQLRGDPVDPRIDVWAFGCVLFECLTGRAAFEGATPQARIAATTAARPDLDAIPPRVPPEVRALVESCLRIDPEGRPASLGEVRGILADVTAPLGAIPPGTTDAPHNLPTTLTPFVGRDAVSREVIDVAARERLVSLTGAGGSGKTRLATEIARRLLPRFPDGVWLVELAPLTDGSRILPAVARAMGRDEEPGRPLDATLADLLASSRTLIVLDNCEHLLAEAAEAVAWLREAGSGVHVLATSREPLDLPGEVLYPVPTLELPPRDVPSSPATLVNNEAVTLFVQRARAANPRFTLTARNAGDVVQVVCRLDGIPLALELAAARVRSLPVDEIARRLDDRFGLLTGGHRTAAPRHRTLRALIDWSHDQLEPAEKAVLARLSVFAAPVALDAAERVAAGGEVSGDVVLDLVARLTDKSLLELLAPTSHHEGAPPRYRMLETVREYARERLEARGETEDTIVRHRRLHAELAADALVGFVGGDQGTWIQRMHDAQYDLVAAVERGLPDPSAAEEVLTMTAALTRFYEIRSRWREGKRLCEMVLAVPHVRSRGGSALARVHHRLGATAAAIEPRESLVHYEEAARLWREAGDDGGLAGTLNNLGLLTIRLGDVATATRLFEEALATNRRVGNRHWEATNLVNLGMVSWERRDPADAHRRFEEALALARTLGDETTIAAALDNLALAARDLGDRTRARRHHEESLEIYRGHGNRRGISASLLNLGTLAHSEGDLDTARDLLTEALALKHATGEGRGIAITLDALAGLEAQEGRPVRAATLFGAATALREKLGVREAPAIEEIRETDDALVRALLPPDVHRAAAERGRRMSMDEAVRYASTLGH
jgi:non-specific serine/threonine protein kinase